MLLFTAVSEKENSAGQSFTKVRNQNSPGKLASVFLSRDGPQKIASTCENIVGQLCVVFPQQRFFLYFVLMTSVKKFKTKKQRR